MLYRTIIRPEVTNGGLQVTCGKGENHLGGKRKKTSHDGYADKGENQSEGGSEKRPL